MPKTKFRPYRAKGFVGQQSNLFDAISGDRRERAELARTEADSYFRNQTINRVFSDSFADFVATHTKWSNKPEEKKTAEVLLRHYFFEAPLPKGFFIGSELGLIIRGTFVHACRRHRLNGLLHQHRSWYRHELAVQTDRANRRSR